MSWNDAQACYLANLAGSIYARGIKEAPGHVALARAEYHQISRAWHSWIGFALYLGARDSGPIGTTSLGAGTCNKRGAIGEISLTRGYKMRERVIGQRADHY